MDSEPEINYRNSDVDNQKIKQIKSRLPSKLKVVSEAWNPILELLALGLDNGKIMVKAIDRKTCWKRSLGEDHGIVKNVWKSAPPSKFTIQSMTWSPDGEILAVSMNNGFIHMLTAAAGKIGYTVEGQKPYEQLTWERIIPKDACNKNDSSLSFATASGFDFNDDGPKECAQQIADMEGYFHHQLNSFHGTVLIGFAEEGKLHLYINGIMFSLELDVFDHYEVGPYADRTSLEIVDCGVSDETKQLESLYKITEMEISSDGENNIVTNTFLVKYDLGWDRGTFNTLTFIANLFFKINFLLIYIREMVRYTANGLEDSTETFYQKVIRSFLSSYRTTSNTPWTFFHEMVSHLTGGPVSIAYFDSFKKVRPASSMYYYPKLITEFNQKKLGVLSTGIQRIKIATETAIRMLSNLVDCYSIEFLNCTPRTLAYNDPEITPELKDFYSYYGDLFVFLQLIEKIHTLLDKKRRGFHYLNAYVTHVATKPEESWKNQLFTTYLEKVNVAEFLDFIGESLVRSDVRIPSSLLQTIIPDVPRLEVPNKTGFTKHQIAKIIEPIGCYPLPRYIAHCNFNCHHNSEYFGGDQEPVSFKTENNQLEVVFRSRGNLKKANPIVSILDWRTECYFDFFTKYFVEYGSAKFPPQGILDFMNERMKEIQTNEELMAPIKKIFGRGKYSTIYEIDDSEVICKMALRPTIFLGLMPLFNFESRVVKIVAGNYPTFIQTEVIKPADKCLHRQRSSDSDTMKSLIDSCTQITCDDYKNRWNISEDEAFKTMDAFLWDIKKFEMGT